MKTFIHTLALATMLAFAFCAAPSRAQDNTQVSPAQDDNTVSFQTFYDQLANQGAWVQTDKYGYVFQPTESDPNWRPYTYGHWVNTDAGMTWVSDDSFGWATDHYGRWANIDGYGWVWVPGYTWAPAWVSWRSDNEDVGWAPLPPDSDQGIDYYNDDDYFTDADVGFGFHIGDDCDVAYGIGPAYYNFCPIAFIGDRDCWRHFRDRRDNFALIGRTRNVTNINFRRDGAGRFGHVREGGPSVAALNAHARNRIENAQLTSASRVGDAGLHGNHLAVFAPRVNPATVKTSRPNSVSRTLTNTQVNRGTDINRPLDVNSGIRPAGPTPDQVRAANTAPVSSNARIAGTNTHISRPLTQPLTSLRTRTTSSARFGETTRSNTTQAPRVGSTSVSNEARFTGASIASHSTMSSSGESRFTGESVTPRTSSAFHNYSSYNPIPNQYRPSSAYQPSAPAYRSQPSFQSSAPAFRQSSSAFHSQPAFQSSAAAFHSSAAFHQSAPSFHAQSSFRAAAPAPHFNSAPAAHVGGGGGGGHPAGGGGAVHASAGGGGHR